LTSGATFSELLELLGSRARFEFATNIVSEWWNLKQCKELTIS
jgi:hypothetical protein